MAQLRLALCHISGEGATKNAAEGINWLRKAIEQNLPEAKYLLGLLHQSGNGVRRSYPEALKWISKAAAQSDKLAIERLKQN